jgi:hypothetical protein
MDRYSVHRQGAICPWQWLVLVVPKAPPTLLRIGREFIKSRKHAFLEYEPSFEATPYHPAAYREIRDLVLQEYGLKAASWHVTQVKRKHGVITQGGQSRPLPEGVEPPQVPPAMEAAVEAALWHFHMIEDGSPPFRKERHKKDRSIAFGSGPSSWREKLC